jgi:hypothetical protein
MGKDSKSKVLRIYAVLCIRFEFLELQDRMLTTAFDSEREKSKHRHFPKLEDIPMRKIKLVDSADTIGNPDGASYI